jgi:hypothetical protein
VNRLARPSCRTTLALDRRCRGVGRIVPRTSLPSASLLQYRQFHSPKEAIATECHENDGRRRPVAAERCSVSRVCGAHISGCRARRPGPHLVLAAHALAEEETAVTIMIHDGDRKFARGLDAVCEAAGARVVLTPLMAPRANAHAGRWVGVLAGSAWTGC